jgi:hypothetical protein
MRVAAVMLVMGSLAAGCGGSKEDSPLAAFEAFRAAVVAEKFEEIYDLADDATRAQVDALAEHTRRESVLLGPMELAARARGLGLTVEDLKTVDGRALLAAQCRKSMRDDHENWEKVAHTKYSRVYVDRDRAKLFVSIDGRESLDDPMLFVRERGVWKVDLAGE